VSEPAGTGTVRTLLRMRTRPGCEQEFVAAWRSAAEEISRLPGNVRQDLHRDADDPRTFLILSEWTDRARLDAFGRSEQRDRLMAVVRELRESAERSTYHVLHSVPARERQPR
jgi:quinol monooxygenase YgiN